VRLLSPRPPYTVVALAVFVVVIVLVSLVRDGPHGRWVGAALLFLVVTYGLVRGLWPAWVLLLVVAVGDILVGFANWPDRGAPATIALNAFMLALLLAESTRRYARRGRPRILDRLGFGRAM
jgi:hypothetical protein